MSYETKMRKYYEYLQARDLDRILTLFAPTAVVFNPIFGELPVKEFMAILLDRAKSHKIKIHDIFYTHNHPQRAATYLNAKFVTKDGAHFAEDGVHIYDFSKEGLIEKITVVIDTFPFHDKYAEKS